MDVPQHFCVRWNSYKSNLQTAFPKLLTSEHFVDVTLACEKQFIKCHKIVLSACSVYFETLLVNNPCQHPIIFMKDVEFWEIKALVEFMYKGEVNVSQNQLDSLLKSAESLQIRGLSGTKQFVNFEQNNENYVEGKGKRNNDNEGEDDGSKKRKKKNEDDEKCVQITTIKGIGESIEDKSENVGKEECNVIKEEIVEDDYNYETGYMDTGEDEDGEGYGGDVFYLDNSNDPGPSGISEFISLEDLPIGDYVRTPEKMNLKSKFDVGTKSLDLKRPTTARRNSYKQYSMTSMWAALERIKQGLSVYRASLEYGVPRKTLRNWMKKYNILSYYDLRKQKKDKSDFNLDKLDIDAEKGDGGVEKPDYDEEKADIKPEKDSVNSGKPDVHVDKPSALNLE